MVVTEKINLYVQKLPENKQAEVLDFIEFLMKRAELQPSIEEDRELDHVSLTLAMRGLEDENEPSYSVADLKLSYH